MKSSPWKIKKVLPFGNLTFWLLNRTRCYNPSGIGTTLVGWRCLLGWCWNGDDHCVPPVKWPFTTMHPQPRLAHHRLIRPVWLSHDGPMWSISSPYSLSLYPWLHLSETVTSSFIAFCWACPIVPTSFKSLTPLLQLLGFPFSFVCLVNAILPRDHQLDHEATSAGVETVDQIWAQVGCYDFRRECELRLWRQVYLPWIRLMLQSTRMWLRHAGGAHQKQARSSPTQRGG